MKKTLSKLTLYPYRMQVVASQFYTNLVIITKILSQITRKICDMLMAYYQARDLRIYVQLRKTYHLRKRNQQQIGKYQSLLRLLRISLCILLEGYNENLLQTNVHFKPISGCFRDNNNKRCQISQVHTIIFWYSLFMNLNLYKSYGAKCKILCFHVFAIL